MTATSSSFRRRWRDVATIVALGVPLAVLFTRAPIAQDQAYHAFAGDGAGAIPNLWNVASNLPFLAVGLLGLLMPAADIAGSARRAWSVFFLGTALVTFGSVYYHWSPNDATLVWDRLPITIAFMSLFAALVAENVDPKLEGIVLVPALLAGIASVAWWRYSGDLRFYVGVQGGALLALPVILALYPPRFTHRRYLAFGLALYVVAKLAELYDREIYSVTAGWIGGHALKHLLAAASAVCVWVMLRRREAVERK